MRFSTVKQKALMATCFAFVLVGLIYVSLLINNSIRKNLLNNQRPDASEDQQFKNRLIGNWKVTDGNGNLLGRMSIDAISISVIDSQEDKYRYSILKFENSEKYKYFNLDVEDVKKGEHSYWIAIYTEIDTFVLEVDPRRSANSIFFDSKAIFLERT